MKPMNLQFTTGGTAVDAEAYSVVIRLGNLELELVANDDGIKINQYGPNHEMRIRPEANNSIKIVEG